MKFPQADSDRKSGDSLVTEAVGSVQLDRLLDAEGDPRKLSRTLIGMNDRVKTKGFAYMRMSELESVCPRECVIHNRNNHRVTDVANFASVVQMDQGSAMHWWVQNSETYFGNRRIGFWKCYACGDKYFGAPPTGPCMNCGAHQSAIFYEEYWFRLDTPALVTGKLDLIVRLGESTHRIVEIKTYPGDETQIPRPKDVMQLAGYLHFAPHYDLPIQIDPSVGYLMYFGKSFNFSKPVMTYAVRPNDAIIDVIRHKTESFTAGVKDGQYPPVLEKCRATAFAGGKAKGCAAAEECRKRWEGEEV